MKISRFRFLAGVVAGTALGLAFTAAAATGGISGLFELVGAGYKLVGTNIKDYSVGAAQIGTGAVTDAKIVGVAANKVQGTVASATNAAFVPWGGVQNVTGVMANPATANLNMANRLILGIGNKQHVYNCSNDGNRLTADPYWLESGYNNGAWGGCSIGGACTAAGWCTTETQRRFGPDSWADGAYYLENDDWCECQCWYKIKHMCADKGVLITGN